MNRAAQRILAILVAHSRPASSQMTYYRALENALKSKGISKEFDEWFAIAMDRPKRGDSRLNPIPNLLVPDS